MATHHTIYTPEELQREVWKPAPLWEGLYEVSDLGRLRRANRSRQYPAGRLLAQSIGSTGFVYAKLSRHSADAAVYIHGLVALAFLRPCEFDEYVSHADGDATNNRADNLCFRRSDVIPHDNCVFCHSSIEEPERVLAYAAGMLDGEGCISIGQNKRRHHLYVGIVNTDFRIVEWLTHYFGGGYDVKRWSLISDNRRDCYKWRLGSNRAAAFLEHLLPYSVLKREQIEIGVRLQKHLRVIWHTRASGLTDEEFGYRESLRRELMSLTL